MLEDFRSAPRTGYFDVRLQAALQAVRPPIQNTESHPLVSPIQHLSPELLQNIFAFCLAEYPAMNTAEAPLLLGHVCRSWRGIVYGTGDLWSAIHVIISPANRSGRLLAKFKALSEWLSRSAGYPLRISMHTVDSAADISSFLDIIIPHSPRWERIVLAVPNTKCFEHLEEAFGEGFSRPLPLLCSFELIEKPSDGPLWRTRFGGDLFFSPFRFLNHSPNIRQVSIHLCTAARYHSLLSDSIAASMFELDLDYHHIFNSDLGQFLSFLSPFQLLHKLRIRACFTKFASPSSTPQFIDLPRLECLSVDMSPFQAKSDSSHNLTFLNHLVTPSLLHLALHDVLFVKDVAVSLTNLFSRSLCSLKTLSLRLTDVSGDMSPLFSCLRYSTGLIKLIIDRWDGALSDSPGEKADAFLLGLAYDSGQVDCCPNLTHLKLGGYAKGIDFESLLVLVRSRMRPPPGCVRIDYLDLRNLEMPWVSEADAARSDFLKAIEQLEHQAQGISVSFPPTLWDSFLCWP